MVPRETSQALEYRVRCALLIEWDPIRVQQFAGAQDEYDLYAPDICRMLSQNATRSRFSIIFGLWRRGIYGFLEIEKRLNVLPNDCCKSRRLTFFTLRRRALNYC
jgi:hypothetical protein